MRGDLKLRKLTIWIVAGVAITLGGCNSTTTAPEGSAVVAASTSQKFTLTDGTYKTVFPGDFPGFGSLCGTMVVSGGGQSINYSSGGCGKSPGFRSGGSFDGSTIRIRQATLALTNVTSSSISGKWRLGSYTANVTFKK